MLDQLPAIKMPAAIATLWLAALRSGEYTQGRYCLRDTSGGYCCLGVLEQVVSGQVEMRNLLHSRATPSVEWLKEHGIQFREDYEGEVQGTCTNPSFRVLRDDEVYDSSAAELNDEGISFEAVADILEPLIETY